MDCKTALVTGTLGQKEEPRGEDRAGNQELENYLVALVLWSWYCHSDDSLQTSLQPWVTCTVPESVSMDQAEVVGQLLPVSEQCRKDLVNRAPQQQLGLPARKTDNWIYHSHQDYDRERDIFQKEIGVFFRRADS